jgi:hypothetical protein
VLADTTTVLQVESQNELNLWLSALQNASLADGVSRFTGSQRAHSILIENAQNLLREQEFCYALAPLDRAGIDNSLGIQAKGDRSYLALVQSSITPQEFGFFVISSTEKEWTIRSALPIKDLSMETATSMQEDEKSDRSIVLSFTAERTQEVTTLKLTYKFADLHGHRYFVSELNKILNIASTRITSVSDPISSHNWIKYYEEARTTEVLCTEPFVSIIERKARGEMPEAATGDSRGKLHQLSLMTHLRDLLRGGRF